MSTRPVVVRIDGDPRGLINALNRIDGRIARTEHTAARTSKALQAAFAGGAVLSGLRAVTRTAGEFDTAMREAGSAAGANEKDFVTLGASARKAGMDQKVGATQAALAQRELARAGLSVKNIVGGGMVAALNLASASGEQVADTSMVVANALNAFGLSGRDAGKVADQLTISANATTSSVGDTGLALAQAAAGAKTAGMSLTDTNVALTALAKLGVRGSDAGTSLKTTLVHLVKPSKKAAEAMREHNLEFFNGRGEIKSMVEVAGMLEDKLGGLTRKQRTQVLATIAGTDGFRALIALMDQGADGAGKLERMLQKQGVAAQQAAQRNAGTGGAIREATAAWEEAKLKIADGAAPVISRELKKFSEAVKGASENGTIERTLESMATGMEAAADVGEDFVRVGGGLLDIVSRIPGPVLQAAIAFKAWGIAAAMAAGPVGAASARGAGFLAMVRGVPAAGGAGAAGAAGAAAAGARGAGGPIPPGAAGAGAAGAGRLTFTQGRIQQVQAQQAAAAARAQSAVAQREAMAAQARVQAAAASTAGSGYSRMAERAAAQQARAAAVANARTAQAAAQAQREAAAAARTATMRSMRPTAGKTAGVVAAAGIGTALSGGDTKSAMLAAGAVGMMGGPWVAAGAALGAGAISEIVKYTKGRGEEEFRKLGEAVAAGAGKDFSKGAQKQITAAKKRSEDAHKDIRPVNRATRGTVLDASTSAQIENKADRDRAARADQALGKTVGTAFVGERLKGKQFLNTTSIAAELRQRTKGQTAEARAAAAAPVLAYINELSKTRPEMKGAASRLVRQLNLDMGKATSGKKLTAKLLFDAQIKLDAQGSKNSLEKALRRQEGMFLNVGKAADTGFKGITSTANRRLGELAKIMHGSTGATKKERAAAASEYAKLQRAVARFSEDSASSFKKFGNTGVAEMRTVGFAMGKVGGDVDSLQGKLDKLTSSSNSLAGALENFAGKIPDASTLDYSDTGGPAAPKPKKKPKKKRAGGLVQAFQGGGIPVAVSSQEALRFPDGRWGMVPGDPVAADNVFMSVPQGTEVYTGHGQELLSSGATRQEALRDQMPHFAGGGKVIGKTSWFGGPNDASTRGRKTATGTTANVPGVAIRPGATFQSGRPYLRGWWDVHVAGKHSVLQQIDLGPHQSTGKRIDITSAALGRFGFSEKTFPTGSTGWAAWLGKDRAAAGRRAAKGAAGGDIASPIMVGQARRNVPGLMESGGFGRGQQYDAAEARRFGISPAAGIAAAWAQVENTRRVAQQSSGLGGSSEGGRLGKMIAKASAIEAKGYQYAWGGGHGRLGVPSRGSRHAHGVGPVGLGFDCSGGVSAVLGAAGLVKSPMTSGALMSWGKKAKGGEKLAVYADAGHTIMRLGSRFWGTSNSNHKGGAGWISSNTMKGRGAVRTAAGFRVGGVAGRPKSPPLMDLEEGFRNGGTAKQTGKVLAVASSGGDLQSRVESMLAMLDGVAFGKLETIRQQVQAAANAPGSKRGRTNAQAALSAIDETLDQRLGASVRRGTSVSNARASNNDALSLIQTIRGTAGTEAGIRGQITQEKRFQAQAPGAREGLLRAVQRAERLAEKRKGDPAALAALAETKAALSAFEKDMLSSAAAVAELGRAADEAAAAEKATAMERRGTERVAGMKPLDLAQAEASLTKSLTDDADVQTKRIAEAQAELAATRADVTTGMATNEDVIAAIALVVSEQERGNSIAEQAAADANAKADQLLAIREEQLRAEKAKNASLSADLRGFASWSSLQSGRNVRALASSGSRDPYGRSR